MWHKLMTHPPRIIHLSLFWVRNEPNVTFVLGSFHRQKRLYCRAKEALFQANRGSFQLSPPSMISSSMIRQGGFFCSCSM